MSSKRSLLERVGCAPALHFGSVSVQSVLDVVKDLQAEQKLLHLFFRD